MGVRMSLPIILPPGMYVRMYVHVYIYIILSRLSSIYENKDAIKKYDFTTKRWLNVIWMVKYVLITCKNGARDECVESENPVDCTLAILIHIVCDELMEDLKCMCHSMRRRVAVLWTCREICISCNCATSSCQTVAVR